MAPATGFHQALQGYSTCASCYFGAASTTIHTYPAALETVTVKIVPHITVYPHQSNVTSLATVTEYPSGSSVHRYTTYYASSDITWTASNNVTLTYPTTYIEYNGFEGAAHTKHQCLQTSAVSAIALPKTTNPASFYYALGKHPDHLPSALLDYLDTFPQVTSQLHGLAATACAPIFPDLTTSVSSTTTATSAPSLGADDRVFGNVAPKPQKHKTAIIITTVTGRPIVTKGPHKREAEAEAMPNTATATLAPGADGHVDNPESSTQTHTPTNVITTVHGRPINTSKKHPKPHATKRAHTNS